MPLVVFAPYILAMLPLTLRATTGKLIMRNGIIGLAGFCVTDPLATYSRDALYWPIVVKVFKEQKDA